MNLMKVHKKAERDKLKREIMRKVERTLVWEITTGMKAVFLLALKKEGWGKQRALRLFEEVERIEQGLLDGKENNNGGINWDDIFDQVKEEYGIDFRFEEMRTQEQNKEGE